MACIRIYIDKNKNIIRQDACMKFYDALMPLHLETDTSSISQRAGLSQVMDGVNCGQDEILGNTTLHPIAFTSESLSSVKLW